MGRKSREKKERRASPSEERQAERKLQTQHARELMHESNKPAKPRRRVFELARMGTIAFGFESENGGFQVIGTGFVVSAKGLAVTAKHVVDKLLEDSEKGDKKLIPRALLFGPAKWTAKGPGQGSIQMAVAAVEVQKAIFHQGRDLACVKLGKSPPLQPLPIDYSAKPFEGDEIATCGFPYGINAVHEGKSIVSSFLTGIVSAVVPHPIVPADHRLQYLLELPVNPGNSGGAVFDPDTGCVIGVVSRRFAPNDIPTGLSIAEPIHLARNLIEQF